MKYPPREMKVEHLNWLMLVFSTELPSQAKLLAAYLSTYMNAKQHLAWPSIGRMQKECSMSRASVCKYLAILQEEGWLTKKRKGGVIDGKNTSSAYALNWPKEIRKAAEDCANLDALQGRGSPSDELPPSSGGGLGSPCDGLGVVREVNTNRKGRIGKDLREREPHTPAPNHPETGPNGKPPTSPKNGTGSQGDPPRRKPSLIDPLSLPIPDRVDPDAWARWWAFKCEGKPTWAKAAVTATANQLARYPPEAQRQAVDYSLRGGEKGPYHKIFDNQLEQAQKELDDEKSAQPDTRTFAERHSDTSWAEGLK